MNLSEGRLAPVPGADGLVTRTAGAVLFVAARTPAEQVRALTSVVAAQTDPTPGRALARKLGALVAADDDGALPGFAVVASSPGGTYVRVYGAVEVHLQGDAGSETLSGVGSFTGTDREISGPFHTIAVAPAGETVPGPVFDIDVQAGTAPGNGFSITTLTGDEDDAPAPTPVVEDAAEVPTVALPDPMLDAPSSVPAPETDPEPVVEPEPLVEPELVVEPEPEAAAAPEPEAPSEAEAVAGMRVVSDPTPEVSVSPPADAETNPYTSSASTEAAASEAAAGLDAPTQAWTPSTADFDADDVVAGAASAAAGAPEPAWGSPEPDAPSIPSLDKAPADEVAEEPAADAPDWGFAATEAPGTPTPPPESAPAAGPATAPPPSAPLEPTPFESLPVADDLDEPAAEVAPPPHEPATEAIPAGAAAAADAPPAEFTSQLLGALDTDEPEAREALPVELDPAEVRQPDANVTSEVQVQGVICSRGHFNDPRSRFCSSCGISMVQNTQILTQGPRPPLGVMVFEDGATFSLSSDYVVGRQPEVSELVQQGLALPLPVDDPERSISRAHAELRLVDWDVHLVNLSGTNGSFVWDENGQQWVPIPEGQSVVLTPGMRVALGRRSAVFESSLVR